MNISKFLKYFTLCGIGACSNDIDNVKMEEEKEEKNESQEYRNVIKLLQETSLEDAANVNIAFDLKGMGISNFYQLWTSDSLNNVNVGVRVKLGNNQRLYENFCPILEEIIKELMKIYKKNDPFVIADIGGMFGFSLLPILIVFEKAILFVIDPIGNTIKDPKYKDIFKNVFYELGEKIKVRKRIHYIPFELKNNFETFIPFLVKQLGITEEYPEKLALVYLSHVLNTKKKLEIKNFADLLDSCTDSSTIFALKSDIPAYSDIANEMLKGNPEYIFYHRIIVTYDNNMNQIDFLNKGELSNESDLSSEILGTITALSRELQKNGKIRNDIIKMNKNDLKTILFKNFPFLLKESSMFEDKEFEEFFREMIDENLDSASENFSSISEQKLSTNSSTYFYEAHYRHFLKLKGACLSEFYFIIENRSNLSNINIKYGSMLSKNEYSEKLENNPHKMEEIESGAGNFYHDDVAFFIIKKE